MSEQLSGLSGPMFEPADSGEFRSIHRKAGAHYNTFEFHSMAALREFFPNGADAMNFVLFSTSGVHGTYNTIEEIETSLTKYGAIDSFGDDTPDDWCNPSLTVLIVQPRIVCLRYGCVPVTLADIPYLKALGASSWAACQEIGKGDA